MTHSGAIRKIELLAPARDRETGRVAIDAGADAVYIGGPTLGARAAAGNAVTDIEQLAHYAHGFGAKVYATLNTLIFEEELGTAEKIARELISAGVDALIVQDMSFLRMGLSGVELHASTQMCNTTPSQVEFLRECGFSRAILERGLTLKEIGSIAQVGGIELECFVHGAICVGFSGQCYMSRSMSKRSGNRGDCSQPCRLTYDLLNGENRKVISEKHLLSVLDLNLSDHIPQLLDVGVTSFKIEGRLKDANYVRNIVGYYRQAIDKALVERPDFIRSSSGHTEYDFIPHPSRSFTRGFTTWMLEGKNKDVASFSTPKAVGEYIGKVRSVNRNSFLIPSDKQLHPGDGICFIVSGELTGTNVNNVDNHTVYPNRMDGIRPGVEIYRNHNHVFNSLVAKSQTRRVVNISIEAHLTPTAIQVIMKDEDGNRIGVTEKLTTEPARDMAKMKESVRMQLSKLGDTIFAVESVEVKSESQTPFVPASKLNEIRRKAVELLSGERLKNRLRSATIIENKEFPYPDSKLSGETNVTNSLAEQFYRDHGVTEIAEPFELMRTLSGQRIMTSAYCLRRELGQCLKNKPTLLGPLRLKRGAITWLLEFDCNACRMNIIKE